MPRRLAIVLSHPIQYFSPWFRSLAEQVELKVFYLWDFGVKETKDPTFQQSFVWDIPLLEGYDYEFVPNRSSDPGTHHFRGLDNPDVSDAIRNWRPDAILMFGYNFLTHLRVILSPKLRGIPIWFRGDSHDLYRIPSVRTALGRNVRRVIFRRFARFLAVGAANADYFRNCGVPSNKIVTISHCVDNERFRETRREAENSARMWKRDLGIPENATVVLFAGKFEEKKRPLDLLNAFVSGLLPAPSCDLRPPTSVLLFVGSGPLQADLEAAAGMRLGVSIFFAPFQNQTQMPKVYAMGDLLVLPSFGCGETWGLAVNEAMNLGRPAIVSDHVGCGRDLVIPGETGWVFPAGDIDALHKTLEEALGDSKRLKQLGENAHEHVASFSYERATETLTKMFDEGF